MQLTAAVQGSGPILRPDLSVVLPVLPVPLTRDRVQSNLCTASLQDSIPVSPVTLPGLPDAQRLVPGPAPATKSLPVSPPTIVRPRSASVSRRISKSNPFIEQDIPLYLVPHIIARAIWQRGELTFRISVIRTKQHYYTIRLRTARPGTRTGTKPRGKSRSGKNKPGCPGKTG